MPVDNINSLGIFLLLPASLQNSAYFNTYGYRSIYCPGHVLFAAILPGLCSLTSAPKEGSTQHPHMGSA